MELEDIQELTLEGRPKKVSQYYFLNNFNEIQLLYPDYTDKFKKFRFLDLVEEQDPNSNLVGSKE